MEKIRINYICKKQIKKGRSGTREVIENLKKECAEFKNFDPDRKYDIEQFKNWQRRKIPYIKGEYFLSKKFFYFYNKFERFLKVTPAEALENMIAEIQRFSNRARP